MMTQLVTDLKVQGQLVFPGHCLGRGDGLAPGHRVQCGRWGAEDIISIRLSDLFENLPSGAATGMAGPKGVWLQKETCQAFVVKSAAFDVLFRYRSMAEADPFSTGRPGWGPLVCSKQLQLSETSVELQPKPQALTTRETFESMACFSGCCDL